MSDKQKKSDLKNAGLHFRNAVFECILGSAYLAKGLGDFTKNRNYRQQILDSAYSIIDSGLSMFIKYAEQHSREKGKASKNKGKSSKQSRKIKID